MSVSLLALGAGVLAGVFAEVLTGVLAVALILEIATMASSRLKRVLFDGPVDKRVSAAGGTMPDVK